MTTQPKDTPITTTKSMVESTPKSVIDTSSETTPVTIEPRVEETTKDAISTSSEPSPVIFTPSTTEETTESVKTTLTESVTPSKVTQSSSNWSGDSDGPEAEAAGLTHYVENVFAPWARSFMPAGWNLPTNLATGTEGETLASTQESPESASAMDTPSSTPDQGSDGDVTGEEFLRLA